MANIDDAFGAKPVLGEGKQARIREYDKKTSVVIAENDFVTADATGTVDLAVAGETLLGVAAAYAAAADAKVKVYDDPEMVFEVQCSADFAAADVFQNADILATSYDTALNQSKHEVDSSSFAGTSTLQLKLLGLSKQEGAELGSYAKVRVKINNHALHTGVAGI